MEKNQYILFNTIIMNIKTLIIIVLSFITSRYTLKLLGVEGYGLYFLIAGLTATFEFLCSAMASTTSRYFILAEGKKDFNNSNILFNTLHFIYKKTTTIILLIIEVFGIIMLFTFLKIPEGKVVTSIIIFQIMVFDTYYKLKVIPYNSLLIAKENFVFINLVSIGQSILKLGLVLFLFLIPTQRIFLYTASIFILSYFARFYTQKFVSRRYFESFLDKTKVDFSIKKDIISFLKYTWIGQLAGIIQTQGTNFLLNIFSRGVIYNATFAVARQVTSVSDMAFTPISQTIMPQTLKSYSEQNYSRFQNLTIFNSKLGIMLSWLVIIPLFVEIDFVFNIWLEEVPPCATYVARVILISEMIKQLYNGLSMSCVVSDKVKRIYLFQTIIRIVVFMSITLLLYFIHFIPLYIFYVDILVNIVYLFLYLQFVKRLGIKIGNFVKKVLIPCCIGGVVSIVLALKIQSFIFFGFISHLLFVIGIVLVLLFFFIFFVLSKEECTKIKNIIVTVIIKFINK